MNKKFWNRAYALDMICTVCVVIPMTYVMPLIPIYVQHTLNASGSVSGLIVALFNIAALICSPFLSYLTDRRRKKYILIAGFAILTINSFLYQFANSITFLYFIRIIHGIGHSFGATAVGSIPGDVQPPEYRHKASALYGTIMTVAVALGPVLGLSAYNRWGMRTAFSLLPVFCVIGLIAAIMIPKEQETAYACKPSSNKFSLSDCVSKDAAPVSAILGVIYLAYIAIPAFFAVYTRTLGYGNLIITFYLTYMITMLTSRICISKIKLKAGDARKIIIAGIAVSAVGFAVIGLTTRMALFIAAAIIYGAGFGMMQPLLFSAVLSNAKPHERAAANATILDFQYIGMSLGSVIWGAVANAKGYPTIYLACVGVSIVAGIAYAMVNKE